MRNLGIIVRLVGTDILTSKYVIYLENSRTAKSTSLLSQQEIDATN